MKNETKPNWFVPKIHGRARNKKRIHLKEPYALTVVPSGPDEVRSKFRTWYLHVLLSRNSDYPKSSNRVSVLKDRVVAFWELIDSRAFKDISLSRVRRVGGGSTP